MVSHTGEGGGVTESWKSPTFSVYFYGSPKVMNLIQVAVFSLFAIYLSTSVYTNWVSHLVVTQLTDTDFPVAELDFPAVTICSEGLHMEAVERALAKDMELWQENNDNGRRKRSTSMNPDNVGKFMKERFNLEKDESIFDILAAMATPGDVDTAVRTAAVRLAPKYITYN